LAQAADAGTVIGPGATPLAGAAVTASSPSLIEKSRTAVSDAAGLYRIGDLRPGIYTITFVLAGWKPLRRDGVELSGSFTATVNAELSAGALNETVTVTGTSPAVDVHTANHELTLGNDVLRSIPTVRSYNALVGLIPGVVTSANDTVTGTATASFPMHGGRVNEGRLLLDGLTVGSPPNGNSATSYVVDVGLSEEVTFSAGGALGESETSGLVMNIVPRSGGNVMRVSAFASASGERLTDNNITPALEAQAFAAPTPLADVYDVSAAIGGPIVKDRLWFFANAHTSGNRRDVPTVFYNLHAGDPTKWLYAPDKSRPEYSDRTFDNGGGRLTWQLTPRNKLGAFWDAQSLCRRCSGATPGLSEPARSSPEAVGVLGRPLHVTQATWSSPVNNHLLLDAGYGGTFFGVGNFEREPNATRDLIRVVEQCASGCAANGNIPGLAYRSQDFSIAYTGSYLWRGSLSYVSGARSLKVGYQHTLMTDDRQWFTNNQDLTYRVSNGVPNQLTQSISPWVNDTRVGWDALYAQGQWTLRRVTLQAALRFDRATSWFPEQHEGPSRFLPQAIVIPETRGVDSYKDITPRVGAAFDLFGNGRTALKLQAGRYLEGAGAAGTYANSNPSLRMPQTTTTFGTAGATRSWTDANQNFVPDCDLRDPAAQDLRDSGGDACGVMSNTNFGRNVLTNNFDPAVLRGWGVRPSDWTLTAAIEHQLFERASLNVQYTHRAFRGFFAADNLALQPSDLTPYSLVAPVDPRLPGGGGYVISGLYDVVPEKAGQIDNLIASANAYGRWEQSFDGLDVTANIRVGRDFTFAGGTSTGQTVADNCDVRAQLPELATTTTGTSVLGAGNGNSAVTPASPYCHVAYGILTQFRGLVSYVVRGAGVQVSAAVQSKPGPMLAANYAAPNAAVAPSLGRSLSGSAPNVTVNLLAPGTSYGDRINQLDLRLGKMLKVGRSRTLLALDIYNALNASTVLTYDNTFIPGGTWLRPTAILTPRFFQFTAQVEF